MVKITINIPSLAEVIIDMVVRYYGLSNSIITNCYLLFISKFWSLLYYFFGIKRRLFIVFYPQKNSQIIRQNNTMKAYFQAFVNFEQNDWVWLLFMAEFAYNNIKNANIGYMPFELNCGYHPYVSYEKNLNPLLKLKIAEELSSKLWELMIVY